MINRRVAENGTSRIRLEAGIGNLESRELLSGASTAVCAQDTTASPGQAANSLSARPNTPVSVVAVGGPVQIGGKNVGKQGGVFVTRDGSAPVQIGGKNTGKQGGIFVNLENGGGPIQIGGKNVGKQGGIFINVGDGGFSGDTPIQIGGKNTGKQGGIFVVNSDGSSPIQIGGKNVGKQGGIFVADGSGSSTFVPTTRRDGGKKLGKSKADAAKGNGGSVGAATSAQAGKKLGKTK